MTNVGIRCGAVMYLFHRMHGSFSIAHTSAKNGAAHNPGWNADTTAVHRSTSDCTGADSEGNTSGRPLRQNPDVPSQSWSSVSPWATTVIRAPHIHCATSAIAASIASMCVCGSPPAPQRCEPTWACEELTVSVGLVLSASTSGGTAQREWRPVVAATANGQPRDGHRAVRGCQVKAQAYGIALSCFDCRQQKH